MPVDDVLGQLACSLPDYLDQSLCIVDGSTGLIVYANAAFHDMTGWTPELIAHGTSYADLIHPEDLSPHMMRVLSPRDDNADLSARHLYRLFTPDECLLEVEATHTCLPAGEHYHLLIQISPPRDQPITSVNQTLVSEWSSTAVQAIIKHAPVSVAVFDVNMLYLAVSDRLLMDYGLDVTDILGRHCYEVFPETPERWREIYRRCLAGAVESREHDEFERTDGTIIYNRWEVRPWYTSQHQIGGIIVFSEVTTARRAAEIALRESEQRLSLATETGGIGIWDWDITSGRLLWDAHMARIYGLGDKAIDIRLDDFVGQIVEGDREAVMQHIEAHLMGECQFDRRFRIRRPNGEIRHIQAHGVALREGGTAATRMLGTNIDITEQVGLERQLGERHKMEALGQMAGGMAHDLNNELAAIQGYAGLTASRSDNPDCLRFLERISQATKRAGDLVRSLLAFAQRADHATAPIDLNEVIEDALGILSHTIDRRIKVSYDLDPDLLPVVGDPAALQTAFLNIALNARDAMPDGGILTITSSNTIAPPTQGGQDLGALASQHTICITIKDSGRGIPHHLLDRVCEPFFTTKKPNEGTGLGLPAAIGTLQQHGGALIIESKEDEGTVVSCYLPACDQPSQRILALPASALRRKREQQRVLVIDDEEPVREMMVEALCDAGFDCIGESDGERGRDRYRDDANGFDLVLLDMTMDHWDGTTTYRALREVDKDVCVLVVSGHSLKGDIQTLLEEGATGFLPKPFTIEELAETLRAVLHAKSLQ